MNISPLTVLALRSLGYAIIRVSEKLPIDAPDDAILEFARLENRVIITQDLDFSRLLATAKYHAPSLITLRLSDTAPNAVTKKLEAVIPLIENALHQGVAVTISDRAYRMRPLPI